MVDLDSLLRVELLLKLFDAACIRWNGGLLLLLASFHWLLHLMAFSSI